MKSITSILSVTLVSPRMFASHCSPRGLWLATQPGGVSWYMTMLARERSMITRATSTTISPSTLRAITWNTPWSSGVRYLESIPTCNQRCVKNEYSNNGDIFYDSESCPSVGSECVILKPDFPSRLRDRTLMIRISSGLTKYVNMQFLKWVELTARS